MAVNVSESGHVAKEQAEVPPHLLEYLFKHFSEPDQLKRYPHTVDGFLQFCDSFLRQTRVTSIGYVGDNHELLLTNGDRVMVCPLAADFRPNTGAMQPSHHVAVTGKDVNDKLSG